MKIKILIGLAAITVMFGWHAEAQIYDTNGDYVQTFAGSGEAGYLDGQGQLTKFSSPSQIVADTSSNLYVWDSGNYLIRKITPDGTVSTLAGGGTASTGWGTNVLLIGQSAVAAGVSISMAIDHSNTIWFLVGPASGFAYLLNISTNGYVSVENTHLPGWSVPLGSICFDSANNLYYSGENQIWRYNPSTGISQPFAGNGTPGHVDGNGTIWPEFSSPDSLACDEANNIYVWDADYGFLRRIDQSQNVTTIAGNMQGGNVDGEGANATFTGFPSMFSDNAGNIYFACGTCIRKMNAQTNVVTMAGSFTQPGYNNGAGNLALFSGAIGACISGGTIYVAAHVNERIRAITFNPSVQVVSPANLQLNTYPGLQIIGTVGRTYQIQTSPDFNAWTTKTTLLLNSSPYLWIDQSPVSGNKFYRALMLP